MLTDEEICCEGMKNRIIGKYDDPVVKYDEAYRCYAYYMRNGNFDHLFYCPWCGKKLPRTLSPWDTIKKEYGEDYVRYPSDPKYKPLPPELMKEFETDERWKKRNIGPDDPGF